MNSPGSALFPPGVAAGMLESPAATPKAPRRAFADKYRNKDPKAMEMRDLLIPWYGGDEGGLGTRRVSEGGREAR
jgi:hypothetical protein